MGPVDRATSAGVVVTFLVRFEAVGFAAASGPGDSGDSRRRLFVCLAGDSLTLPTFSTSVGISTLLRMIVLPF